MNKANRKEALVEIHKLLANAPQSEEVKQAQSKVVEMLAHHGLFMLNASAKTE